MNKHISVFWDIKSTAGYTSPVFLEGDFGVGALEVTLDNLPENFNGNLRVVFCNSSSLDDVYVVEEEVGREKMLIDVPNEVFRVSGKVFCRLALRGSDRKTILGSVEEIRFIVAKKREYELLEPLLPEQTKEYVSDVTDELYELLKNSKKELSDYQEELKQEMTEMGKFEKLTVNEAIEIIKKYR